MVILIKALFEPLAILMLCVPTVVELIADWQEFKNDMRDKKKEDVVIRGAMMTVVAFIATMITDHTFLESFALTLGIFVMFFDPIIGYLLTKRLDFLGTTSDSDEFLKRFKTWELFVMRGLFFAATVLIYI